MSIGKEVFSQKSSETKRYARITITLDPEKNKFRFERKNRRLGREGFRK